MQNEEHILIAIANGDKDAFQTLYKLYSSKVYQTALNYTQNTHDAEEITQDVFLSIHRNAVKFKGNSAVNTWIYRITVNTSLNKIKKKKRSLFDMFSEKENEISDFDHPGIILENRENSELMFRVINKLPDQQKTAFILAFIEEHPRQEVADIMDISLKAVESLLQRAKKNLRDKLEKYYPNRRKKKN